MHGGRREGVSGRERLERRRRGEIIGSGKGKGEENKWGGKRQKRRRERGQEREEGEGRDGEGRMTPPVPRSYMVEIIYYGDGLHLQVSNLTTYIL